MPEQNQNHRYIDGVGEVRVSDGVVRMDLLALSATRRDDDGNPVPEFVEQLVMSPRGFMRMLSALGQAVKGMEEKGLIRRNEGDGQTASAPVAPTNGGQDKAAAGEAASPNF